MAQLWGGRFTKETDQMVYEFNASIGFDKRLFHEDIEGSVAHVAMLAKQGILTEGERDKIWKGLSEIREEVDGGKLEIDETCEDIHSFVEAELIGRIGDAGCTPAGAATTRWPWTCGCIPGSMWPGRTRC